MVQIGVVWKVLGTEAIEVIVCTSSLGRALIRYSLKINKNAMELVRIHLIFFMRDFHQCRVE